MANFDNFFNESAKPIIRDSEQKVLTEFKPNPKKSATGVFKAIIRFIPNPENKEEKSIIKKYTVYLKNPITQTAKTIDCPCTISQPDPIQSTYFQLNNSANAILKENAKLFSHKVQYASLIQVLSCESDHSLEGKFLVWKYGSKVYAKIHDEMYPPMGECRDPFNLLTGRPFSVQVKEVANFPNYDSCAFFDLDINQSGMRVISTDAMGNSTTTVVTPQTLSTNEGKSLVFDYVTKNIPSMEKYEYQPWTAEIAEFVNQCIQVYTNPQATLQAASAAQNPAQAQIPQQPGYAQATAQPMAMPAMPSMPAPNAGFGSQAPNLGMNMGDPNIGITPPNLDVNPASLNATTPGGFNAPSFGNNVNDLLGGGSEAKKVAAPQQPMMDLADVLNGQIIGG